MRSMLVAVLGVVVVCLLQTAHSRPPTLALQEDTCKTATLGLTMKSETGYSPVYVLTSASTYSANTRITVTIQAKDGETFNGFKVLARPAKGGLKAGEDRYGTFTSFPKAAHLDCRKQVLTETDVHEAKTSVTFTWVAPSTDKLPATDIKFWVAISKHDQHYWIPFESDVIHFRQGICVDEANCFRNPENCADADCQMVVGWQPEGDYVRFSASGSVSGNEKYLSIGFSTTGTMNPSPTVDCIRDLSNSITIKSAANKDYATGNVFLDPPSLGLGMTKSGEYADGRITCHFSYIKSKSLLKPASHKTQAGDKDLLANLINTKYYLLAAKGVLTEEGNLQYHGVHKMINPKLVNFTTAAYKPAIVKPIKCEVMKEIHQSVCENDKYCFRSPADCADEDCSVMVGWKLDGDYVKFSATGVLTAAEKYLAVGFSTTGLMSPAATVDCIRNGDMVDIKSAHNEQNSTRRNNRFLSPPTLGLDDTKSGTYEDGRITCHFSYVKTKSLLTPAGAKMPIQAGDVDLLADLTDQKYYLLVARGAVTAEGLLTYHITNKQLNPVSVNFTDTSGFSKEKKEVSKVQPTASVCENDKYCFRSPADCTGEDCSVMVGWKLDGDYVKFSATGVLTAAEKYLAVGFSTTGLMSPAATVDCIRNGDMVDIKSAHNEQNSTRRNNRFLSPPTLGLDDTKSGTYEDGRITCHFSYVKTKSLLTPAGAKMPIQAGDVDLLANLTDQKYYLLVARGAVTAEGLLAYHMTNKQLNPVSVNFTDTSGFSKEKKEVSIVQPTANVCEIEDNCFRYPEDCAGDDCNVEVGWKLDGDYVKFTATGLMPITDHWFAIGFSSTGTMSPSPTVDCMRDAATVTIKSGVNQERNNRFLSPPSLGLHETMSGEYVDGRIMCHFSYVKSSSVMSGQPHGDEGLLADLANNKYYLLTAMGPIGADGALTHHGISKVVNSKLINFTEMPSDQEVLM